jgi:tetratricopeptide (TPR) repeat protein
MRRFRRKFDLYIVIFLAVITACYFLYNHYSSEDRGIKAYKRALELYKDYDYENAYQLFAKVPSSSSLKEPALFRQARCATNLGKRELAIKKYKKILRSKSKSSIVPISEYNMANLYFELKDNQAKKHFNNIIKKHPTSDYAIASEYFLGLIEVDNFPENEKKLAKAKEKAFINFKTYIEKAPDGRYAIKSIEEINKLDIKLKNYDNLLIAKAYYAGGDYENAKEYLNKTTLAESWTDFAKNEYKLGNYDKAKYYTIYGLKDHAEVVEPNEIYTIIDNYIAMYPTKAEGIRSLVNGGYTSVGADYISYLNCNELVGKNQKLQAYIFWCLQF